MSNSKKDTSPDYPNWYENVRVQFGTNTLGILPIDISVSPEFNPITIYVSSLLDPFEDMVRWLEQVVDDGMPASWLIKSEEPKELIYLIYTNSLSNDRLDFRITHGLEPDENSPCVLRSVVGRKQLVKQFVKAFRKYIKTDYRPEHWRMDVDLRDFDLSGIMLMLNQKKA